MVCPRKILNVENIQNIYQCYNNYIYKTYSKTMCVNNNVSLVSSRYYTSKQLVGFKIYYLFSYNYSLY